MSVDRRRQAPGDAGSLRSIKYFAVFCKELKRLELILEGVHCLLVEYPRHGRPSLSAHVPLHRLR